MMSHKFDPKMTTHYLIAIMLVLKTSILEAFFQHPPSSGIASCVGTPTLDTALLYSSRAGSDLGRTLDRFEELCQCPGCEPVP